MKRQWSIILLLSFFILVLFFFSVRKPLLSIAKGVYFDGHREEYYSNNYCKVYMKFRYDPWSGGGNSITIKPYACKSDGTSCQTQADFVTINKGETKEIFVSNYVEKGSSVRCGVEYSDERGVIYLCSSGDIFTVDCSPPSTCNLQLSSLSLNPSSTSQCGQSITITATISYSNAQNCGGQQIVVKRPDGSELCRANVDTSKTSVSCSGSYTVPSSSGSYTFKAEWGGQSKTATLSVSCSSFGYEFLARWLNQILSIFR